MYIIIVIIVIFIMCGNGRMIKNIAVSEVC
jgi:hypothetical protein